MRIGASRGIIVAIVFLALGAIAHADTYSTFQTTRYYSTNHQYFVEVTPNKRATLYLSGRRLQQVWSRVLPELPARLFIANDGKRVVMLDYYYGNGRSPSANVLLLFDETGSLIASHSLGEVANLSRVPQTTSSAHWYYGALFTPDQSILIVETIVRKCEPPKWNVQSQEEREAYEECMKVQPYEELRFSMATGKLISRVDIQSKYTDPEKRLLHELELVENEHPPDNLNLADALFELARFYERQRQYARARDFYERAIPIYSRTLGADFFTVAQIVGDAATNYRNLGDYPRAEQFYRRALASLDKTQGNPDSVSPVAITVYEEYAVFLRKLSRDGEAERMERRAKVLRAAYPDYTVDKTR
jgi:tetratricopeptide (TPR) repeat protein